jgi:hypothetical protein
MNDKKDTVGQGHTDLEAVRKAKLHNKEHHKSEAKLGIIRLDYDYPPAPGDMDSPESFAYDVFYRVVPGLTFAMCQANEMSDEIK